MIPGTKQILKKILHADYNNPSIIMPEEPKKPNSLNAFLEFRKEFIDKSKVYQNLPPQEGLYEPEPEDVQQKTLEKEAKNLRENLDFKVIDFEEDLAKMKSGTPMDMDREEEVFEVMEQKTTEQKGELYKEPGSAGTSDSGLVISFSYTSLMIQKIEAIWVWVNIKRLRKCLMMVH